MIQTKKLCKTIGLEEGAFRIEYAGTVKDGYTPYILSDLLMGRQITHESVEDENMFLYEVEMMFVHNIHNLQSELDAIRRFRASFYGPTKGESK